MCSSNTFWGIPPCFKMHLKVNVPVSVATRAKLVPTWYPNSGHTYQREVLDKYAECSHANCPTPMSN